MASKGNVSSRRKRGILAALMAVSASLGKGDGVTFALCVFCGREAFRTAPYGSGERLELCHVVADARGGQYVPENLVLGCYACNRYMRDDTATDYVWSYDPRPFYPATIPNAPSVPVVTDRPTVDRRHGLVRR